MKYTFTHFLLLFFFEFAFSVFLASSQKSSEEFDTVGNYSEYYSILESINTCKWKNDANTCITFSFDDNCRSHKKISDILNKYGYKGTFFVLPDNYGIWVDSLRKIVANGHEVGCHSISHQTLTTLDSASLDYEIRVGKERLEKTLYIKCLSFAEPFHQYNALTRRVVQKNYLFCRNYSAYSNHSHFELGTKIVSASVKNYIDKSINESTMCNITGHGIDSDGWSPISSDYLSELIEYADMKANAGNAWITTIKEGSQYENLYNEIVIKKELNGDTLNLIFNNYNKAKYINLSESPLSISIPSFFGDLVCIKGRANIVSKLNNKIVTLDLKKDTNLVFYSKGLLKQVTSLENSCNGIELISVNKSDNILKINNFGKNISVEIFNLNGKVQLRKSYDVSQVNISNYNRGYYLIKIVNDDTKCISITKILKI